MSIFDVFQLLGGIAFFLYGMHVMSSGLEKMVGGKFESVLKRMTSNPFFSLLLGAGITIAVQSSTALTVMLVGLVNSGIMQLGQTVGIIMGSNIGTTLTAWIVSLAGIESENVFLLMLKPDNFSPILAMIGVILIMVVKKNRSKDIGAIMVGFSILMCGMSLMSSAVRPLADMPEFARVLTAFKNPVLGVIVGALVTTIIQSSAASVGILQALAMTGGITYGMALPIIMGQNIGTCISTAILSSIGVNRNAKRVAVVHISFNVIGTTVCLILFGLLNATVGLSIADQPIGAAGVAMCHSAFNIATTIMLLPFGKQLEKIAMFVIKDKKEKETYTFLDERLLQTPSFAVAKCLGMTQQMAELAKDTLMLSVEMMTNYDEKKAQVVSENEDRLDMFEDKLGTYLVRIASCELTEQDSREVSKMLHSIGDFERIGDHAVALLGVAEELRQKNRQFSPEAKEEVRVLTEAIAEILENAMTSFITNDPAMAGRVEPLEQVIEDLIDAVRMRHIMRLRSGVCTIEMGFVLSDLLTNYKRVANHCSNIAVCVIELDQGSFNTHEYLHDIKNEDSRNFLEAMRNYEGKYFLAPAGQQGSALQADN